MYDTALKMRIPKYLLLTNNENQSYITYEENIEDVFKNIQEGKTTTVYVRNGTTGFYWSYMCDISKGVYND